MKSLLADLYFFLRQIPRILFILFISYFIHKYTIFDRLSIDVLLAIFIMVVYRIILKYTFLFQYTKGLQVSSEEQFMAAIEHFYKSYLFFRKYHFLDRFRAVFLLNVSSYSYAEMSLCNLGYCYAKLNQYQEADNHYKTCLEINPNNKLASTGLSLLHLEKKFKTKP
ncbi:MAG: tetratricopeptide repeat protein [Leptospiraceae bacterium]|nr:tetratricopeptide repeat protein [Leptospiraceae bacterium]MCP5501240.1 tetratricopeptide repeat protein [Leptospiraceae bacterium]